MTVYLCCCKCNCHAKPNLMCIILCGMNFLDKRICFYWKVIVSKANQTTRSVCILNWYTWLLKLNRTISKKTLPRRVINKEIWQIYFYSEVDRRTVKNRTEHYVSFSLLTFYHIPAVGRRLQIIENSLLIIKTSLTLQNTNWTESQNRSRISLLCDQLFGWQRLPTLSGSHAYILGGKI